MNRRQFIGNAATAAVGVNLAARPATVEASQPRRRGRMYAGHQNHSSDADLRILAALGVKHICSSLPSRTLDDAWSVAGLSRLRERVERFTYERRPKSGK